MMVANTRACDAVIKGGVVAVCADLMLYPPNTHDAEERPMADTPELQGRLCHILAGVAIRACDDEDMHKKKSKVAGIFGAKASLLASVSGGKTPHSAEGDKAVISLLKILKEKM